MPPIIAALPALLPGLLSAATVGTSIASMAGVGQPSMPNATPTTPTAPTTPSGPSPEQKAALGQESSNILSSNPYASSTYLSTIAPQLAGAGGPGSNTAMQDILKSIFGQGATFSPSGSPTNLGGLAANPGISDFMTKTASTIG